MPRFASNYLHQISDHLNLHPHHPKSSSQPHTHSPPSDPSKVTIPTSHTSMRELKLTEIDLLITLFLLCPPPTSHSSNIETVPEPEPETTTSGTKSNISSATFPSSPQSIQYPTLSSTTTDIRHRISSSEEGN
ncbi:hypothetical protein VTL71DRAFT_3757 [Oculimacula yallundae]|uniref:Uncharacterized protein n=1 Tax=Oculimacula yallundae TaxID=86028 RepID=A0ABR4C3V9_9HELO